MNQNHCINPNEVSPSKHKSLYFIGNVVIAPNISVGDGSIIAVRSVITKDIEPYSTVGGNPARVIRKQFDDEMIELLLRVKWWNRDSNTIVSILSLLCNNDLSYVK